MCNFTWSDYFDVFESQNNLSSGAVVLTISERKDSSFMFIPSCNELVESNWKRS